ncbi:hypothetical protein CPB85DRAFT_1431966 [Mucidula mucida]|nr:hypothetical protein CPB85DRAFT_1431966 [Mucidula mucida]
MEDTSTPQKPRSKTTDFAGFLRGMGQQRTPEPGALQVPETGVRRRKSSLITFLGRTRKKSSVSSISESEQPDVRDLQRASEAHDQPFPSTSTPHSSFGSLLAARFSGSARRGAVKKTDASATGYTSDSFLEPPRVRRPSVDSTLSAGSATRQPTITVSPSSHLFDDQYDDLFTKPTRKRIPSNPTHPRSPSPSNQDAHSHPSSSPPTAFVRGSRDESGSIRSARNSRLSGMEDPMSGEESEAVSTLSLPISAGGKRRSWDSQNRRFSSTSARSKTIPRTAPPTIPLPTPPVEAIPAPPVISRTASVGRTSSGRKTRPRSLTLSSRASVSPVPTTPTVSSSPPKTRKSQERKSIDDKENEVFDIYTASADQLRTALLARNHQLDELAAYLLKVTQNHVTEKNALEKRIAALERDAAKRDKEIKGLTWLVSNGRSPGASVAGNTLLSTASRSTSALADISPVVRSPSYRHLHSDPEDSGGETSKTDSMRESFEQSGGESSSSVPVMKQFNKVPSRTAPLIKGMSSRGGGFRPTTVERVPISDIRTSRRLDKRSSVSSFASSATSSSSSVMPASPTAATLSSIPEASPPPTPPTPPAPASVLTTKVPSSRDPAIVAAISTQRREKEQKKNTPRSTSKTTATMTTSSAPTPAAAYAANLQKRPRPRSIGQILDFTNTSSTPSNIPPSSKKVNL